MECKIYIYTSVEESSFQLEQRMYSSDNSETSFGKEPALVRRKLDGAYPQISMAQSSWTGVLFIQKGFQYRPQLSEGVPKLGTSYTYIRKSCKYCTGTKQ